MNIGISPFNNNLRKISFASQKLYGVNLKKKNEDREYSLIHANFSELKTNSTEDKALMGNIANSWGRKNHFNYAPYIGENFKYSGGYRSYYVLELKDEENSPETITCIAETNKNNTQDGGEILDLFYIQAHPNIASNKNAAIRGSGELTLYGVVKKAQENGFKHIRICSVNDEFYEKMGFHKRTGSDNNGYYWLDAEDFENFLNKIEKKYGFN